MTIEGGTYSRCQYFWSIRKAITETSQYRSLLSAAENHSPFKMQLLAMLWALGENECLALGQQVTMQLEGAIMNWVCQIPKVGQAQ